MWWTDASDVPALVTTSPTGTDRASAGVLGQPGTQTLLGGSLNDELRSGFRIQGGMWLDCQQTCGIELNYLMLESKNAGYQRGSAGDPIISRPFRDATSGAQVAELAAFPSVIGGSVDASVYSQGLYGWGVNYRSKLNNGSCCGCGSSCCATSCNPCGDDRLDFVVGYRGMRLDDGVMIRERLSSPLFAAGTVLALDDVFETSNTFHGANLGLRFNRQRCRWLLETFGNVGLGATRSRIRIDGLTSVTSPGGPNSQSPGGLLALSSNMGESASTDFTAIFDIGMNIGYQLTRQLSMRVGYTFLFWPNVYRAGDQIDPVVNPNLIPPVIATAGQAMRPRRLNRKTDFWAHGINIGLEYRF